MTENSKEIMKHLQEIARLLKEDARCEKVIKTDANEILKQKIANSLLKQKLQQKEMSNAEYGFKIALLENELAEAKALVREKDIVIHQIKSTIWL